jgi:hypothetical protein
MLGDLKCAGEHPVQGVPQRLRRRPTLTSDGKDPATAVRSFEPLHARVHAGPRYGYHETDIIEQTGVARLDQIEGTMRVHAHHIHNVDHGKGGAEFVLLVGWLLRWLSNWFEF